MSFENHTENDLRNYINALSGKYSFPIWEAVFAQSDESVDTFKNIMEAFNKFYDNEYYTEIFHFLKLIYTLTSQQYPPELRAVEMDMKKAKLYLNEFLADGKEFMVDLML